MPELVHRFGFYELEINQVCAFKAHPCQNCGMAKTNPVHHKDGGTCSFKRKTGCAKCGKAKAHLDHQGAAPTLNSNVMRNPQMFNAMKARWEQIFADLLESSGLPKGMESVFVSARITFPNETRRDEGNIRFFLEKCLGDALVDGGWLVDDSFYPVRRYTFGQLEGEHCPGQNGILIRIFPS